MAAQVQGGAAHRKDSEELVVDPLPITIRLELTRLIVVLAPPVDVIEELS